MNRIFMSDNRQSPSMTSRVSNDDNSSINKDVDDGQVNDKNKLLTYSKSMIGLMDSRGSLG